MARVKRRKPEDEIWTYMIQLDDWWSEHNFSTQNTDFEDTPFWEHLGVEFKGRFLAPQKLRGSIVTLTLSGSRKLSSHMLDHTPREERSRTIGYISASTRGVPCVYITVPLEHINFINQSMSCKHFRFSEVRGYKLRHGKASALGIRFLRALNVEDDPGIEMLPPIFDLSSSVLPVGDAAQKDSLQHK